MDLNDEEFIFRARYTRQENMTKQQRIILETRLRHLGLSIEYGCCGTNILRSIPSERQSPIPKDE